MLRFDDLFLLVLDLTGSATLVILVVLLLRLMLRKAPKIYSYVLWAVVLFRLLFPISLEANWALLPEMKTGEAYTLANDEINFAGATGAAVRAIGDAVNGGLGIQHIRTVERDVVSSYWWEVWILFGKYVWLGGLLIMAICAAFTYGKLRKRLCFSVPLMEPHWSDTVVQPPKPDVFLTDAIQTAFVTGLFRPKIYLPSDLSETEREYILLHERYHIKRGDQFWKLLAFAALCVHWFNPFVWAAFCLAEADMEMSCDEAVLRKLGDDVRKDYSLLLLRFAAGKRYAPGMPLAFGEGDTGRRIRHIMKFKKPAMLISAAAMGVALVAIIVLSVNAFGGNTMLLGSVYRTDLIVYSTDGIGGPTESGPLYAVSADYQLYRKNLEGEPWTHVGSMEPYALSKRELEDYCTWDKGWTTSYRLKEIADAYYLRSENNMFYLVFQTKSGDTLLGYGWEDLGERGQMGSDDTNLRLLYRLKATGDAETTMGLTMTSLLASPLNSLGLQQVGNYYIWGFAAGTEYPDWGYAVFQECGGAFKLMDWYLYENAARARNQIYVCPDPAVLSDDGTMTDKNTYDVVLNQNPQLASIVHVITVDDQVYETNETIVNGSPLILINWADQTAPEPCSVSRLFYHTDGERIEVSSLSQEDLMWDYFYSRYPDVVPLDWVLADDNEEELLGVVIFSKKPGDTEFVFVLDGYCARATLRGMIIEKSDLVYEGNSAVSVVLEKEDGVREKVYLSHAYLPERRETHFEHWVEP